MRSWIKAAIGTTGALLVSPVFAPQLLAFPHSAKVGHHMVYSERQIDAATITVVHRADALVARSPLPTKADQSIFLTEGGWRWRWLTQSGSDGPFGISRPVLETVVINRNDPAADAVFRRAQIGGKRALSGTIAHEITHGAIRRHFGFLADKVYPQWVREGYCDFVAGDSTLSNVEAAALERTDPHHPALIYWRAQKRVEAELARNGGSVSDLFASARS
jgi:hypothetical protein